MPDRGSSDKYLRHVSRDTATYRYYHRSEQRETVFVHRDENRAGRCTRSTRPRGGSTHGRRRVLAEAEAEVKVEVKAEPEPEIEPEADGADGTRLVPAA